MRKNRLVSFIEPVGGHGGMDHYDLGLSQGLIDAGWKVSWYTSTETTQPAARKGLRFRPVYKGIWGKASKGLRAARYLYGTMAALLESTRVGEQICHFHFFHGSLEELLMVILAKLFGRRAVITVHDVESFAGPRATRQVLAGKVYSWADRIIVHNSISRKELMTRLGVPVEKITIIPHGNYLSLVDQKFSSKTAKEKLGIGSSQKVVLFFGQIKEVKGLTVLLEAFTDVASKVSEVSLLIAGRPWKSDFSQFENLIDRLGIRDKCHLHIRFIPNEEVGLYYAAADVVVLPYRRIYQSGVVLLSMSYKRAVLVSDLPGMTEIVQNEENGYIFKNGSSVSLSQSLIRLLQDDSGRRRVAEQGYNYVKFHHDWGEIGRRTAEVYQSIR